MFGLAIANEITRHDLACVLVRRGRHPESRNIQVFAWLLLLTIVIQRHI